LTCNAFRCTPDGLTRDPRKLLRTLVMSVGMVALLATATFLVMLRDAALEDGRSRVNSSARLLSEHMARTFHATQAILDQAATLTSGRPPEQLSGSREIWNELSAMARSLPEPGNLWLIDSSGALRLGTIAFPTESRDVSDRHYFSAHLKARHDLVVGQLVVTKVRNALAFHLSRRIDGPDGSLAGVIAAGFEAATFTDFEPLPLGEKAAILAIDLDGRVILRQPWQPQWANSSIPSSPALAAIRQGASTGTMITNSPLDGIERLVAWRLIPEFGVVVIAGEAMDDVLAPWRRTVWTLTGLWLALALALGILVRFTFAGLAREEDLVRGLEEKVRERTEEAEARAEEARRANDSKTRFLATASHDLRQPLQAAGMFIEALSVRMEGSPHSSVVEKIRQSVDATNALLTTLLDVSTLEAGKVAPNVVRFPLMPLMASLYDQVEAEAAAKGLELRVVPTGLFVESDPVLLERILRNLMLNATRYTQTGRVLLGCRRRGSKIAICVADTGSGIPADKLDTIFEDFTRLGDKNSGFQRGLGLGLGVVRRTAQLLDHPIEVKSVEGKGSCFVVLVPLA